MTAHRPPAAPFAGLADATLIAVAVTYGVLLELAAAAGLLGLPLLVLVSLSLWRYGYEVLKRAAQGRPALAPPGMESMNPFGDFGLVLHFGLFAGLLMMFRHGMLPGIADDSASARALGVAVTAAVFPASAALMALTGDLAASLDPKRIAGLMQVLGRRYLRVLAFAFGIFAAAAIVGVLPLPSLVRALLGGVVEAWVLLAVFRLTGSAVRTRRDVLEIPGEKEPEDERRRREAREDWRRQLDLAYASIRSGLREQGYRTIQQLVDGAGAGRDVHEWVLDDMCRWGDRTHAAAFAARFIERLTAQHEHWRALDIAVRCRKLPGGLALDAATADALAAFARGVGREGLADELAEAAGTRPGIQKGDAL